MIFLHFFITFDYLRVGVKCIDGGGFNGIKPLREWV